MGQSQKRPLSSIRGAGVERVFFCASSAGKDARAARRRSTSGDADCFSTGGEEAAAGSSRFSQLMMPHGRTKKAQ